MARSPTSPLSPMSPSQNLAQMLQQALQCHQTGQLHAAEALYQQVLKRQPRNHDALHYLGVLCVQSQRLDEGMGLIAKSLKLLPSQPQAHLHLGNAMSAAGRLKEALAAYDKALAFQSAYPDAHSNRAHVLLLMGQATQALASADQALRLNAAMAQTHAIRGDALRALSRHAEAVAAYDQALLMDGQPADWQLHRGLALAHLGRLDQAEQAFDMAIVRNPQLADAHSNRGVVLQEQGRLEEAIAAFTQAVRLNPDLAAAHASLGVAWQQQGQASQARECFAQALRIHPQFLQAQGNLLFTLSHDATCAPSEYLAQAQHYGDMLDRHVQALGSAFTAWPCTPAIRTDAPIRVGLLSGDLNGHPVGLFLLDVLKQIDPERLHLVAYPTHAQDDEVSAELRAHAQAWTCLEGLSDVQAAQRIHADGLHLLLDLSGHTARNRLPVMGFQPAPLQASWLGYLASTGVRQIGHILADAVSAPMSSQGYFTERIAHLPETINCFSPPAEDARLALQSTPALKRGHVTFGCYQNLAKISDDMLAAWSAILAATPNARLRIQNRQMTQAASRTLLCERLKARGIDVARVDMAGGVAGRVEHLASHAEVDILLDTFPYPGITTTCEALWMGVPTVTCMGETMLSRQGGSILHTAGLRSWVAHDTGAYVDLACAHAQDIPALNDLRLGLREQIRHTALFNGARFARQFESCVAQLCADHLHPDA
jgi:protein O-GlcNAc transferase